MKKQYSRFISALFTIALSIVMFSVAVYASTEPHDAIITQEKEFTSTDANPQYDGFESIISASGNEYELTDISYTLISSEQQTRIAKKTTERTVSGLRSKSYAVGQTDTITDSGKEYTARIKSVEYEPVVLGNRWGEVSGSKDYGLQTEKPDVPKTMALKYNDSEAGRTLSIDAPLTKLEKTSSQWQDYSYIDIEVFNYTDTKYMFNGDVINNDGSTVLPESYYDDLLRLAEMNDENHKISSIYWLGEPYKSGSKKNRQARADIQAYSAAYTAHYYKKFSLSDVTTYTAKIEYEFDVPVTVTETEYKYKATATYTLVPRETEDITEMPTEKNEAATVDEAKVHTETVIKAITTLSLFLILCLGFVILVMFLMTKFRLRKKDFDNLRRKR